MRTHSRLLFLACTLTVTACGGQSSVAIPVVDGGTDAPPVDHNPDGGLSEAGPEAGQDGGPIVYQSASKVDLLFAIDNSASMGDKQLLLAKTIPDLVHRLVAPNCVDGNGNVVGAVIAGACAVGKPEFAPIVDMHVGIVTSSLGGRGADICNGTNPVGAGSVRHDDDKGHLINRASTVNGTSVDPSEHPTPGMGASNFLAFAPGGDPNVLVSDFVEAVAGVHEYGCGIEAQLESWYRFLVQPDPYASIDPSPTNANQRVLTGVDAEILKQRHDFLRPDSLVAIVMLTDEDDSAADPRALGAQGWAYANSRFPGKTGGSTHMGAPRGTSACDDVAKIDTAACTSCAYPGTASDPNCQLTGDGQAGYYADTEDTLNTRFVRMKQRYGVDPQFPVRRYANGLSSPTVPDRAGELYDGVGSDGNPNASYDGKNDCTNPLFAQNLPTDASAELCKLTPGPRTPDLVVFTTITGVPWQLLTEHPANAGAEGSFLASIPADRWKQIIGSDPSHYDYTGMDPHMAQSTTPRAGIAAGINAGDTADPWHGREWDTGKVDLQYACTFPLLAPKDCTDPKYSGACDCDQTSGPRPPLCDPNKPTTQIRGKAYPGIRQLTLAHDLGDQGVVASLCPRSIDPNDADYGYRPAVRAIVARLAKNLGK